MNPEVLSALLASLANPTHEWRVMSVSTHGHGVGSQVITYQLQSEPLELVLIAMAEVGVTLESIQVYFRGSTLTTTSTALYVQLQSMATAFGPAMQQSFLKVLTRQKEASGRIDMISQMEASGVRSGTS